MIRFSKKRAHASRTAVRGFAALSLTAALAVSGCSSLENDNEADSSNGGDQSAQSESAEASSTKEGNANSASGKDSVATGGNEFTKAEELTKTFGTDAQPGEFPRTIKHARGTTEIKEKPKRVVVLESGELDSVLALGMKPVGMTVSKGQNPVPEYMADQAEGIESVGTNTEVNLEKIAELKPDLIIGSQLRLDKQYDQLADIAPTVFSVRPGYTWKENFRLAAEAMGEEERGEDVMDDYNRKIEKVKETVKNKSIDPAATFTILRFMPGKIRLYANMSLSGTVLSDAGLKRPDNQDIDELATEISPETLDEADADYIFYSSYGDPSATGQDNALESAAFKSLPAVKDGHVYEVSDDAWGLGLGPLGAQQIASDLDELLSR